MAELLQNREQSIEHASQRVAGPLAGNNRAIEIYSTSGGPWSHPKKWVVAGGVT